MARSYTKGPYRPSHASGKVKADTFHGRQNMPGRYGRWKQTKLHKDQRQREEEAAMRWSKENL